MDLSNLKRSFPGFPLSSLPDLDMLPAGFVDTSCRLDGCPVLEQLSSGLEVWIDYPRTAEHKAAGWGRYYLLRRDGLQAETILAGNDWAAICRAARKAQS